MVSSKLLSSFSNLCPQRSNSSLFNFVPAPYVDLGTGFLSTVQDVTKRNNSDKDQSYRGILDFTAVNILPNQEFTPIFQCEPMDPQLVAGMELNFPNAFAMSPIAGMPLSGSLPYTNSSSGFSLFSDPTKISQGLSLKQQQS